MRTIIDSKFYVGVLAPMFAWAVFLALMSNILDRAHLAALIQPIEMMVCLLSALLIVVSLATTRVVEKVTGMSIRSTGPKVLLDWGCSQTSRSKRVFAHVFSALDVLTRFAIGLALTGFFASTILYFLTKRY